MTKRVHPKAAAGGIGGSAAIVLTAVLSAAGVHLSAEVASALATLISFGAAWVKPSA